MARFRVGEESLRELDDVLENRNGQEIPVSKVEVHVFSKVFERCNDFH
jgi:hypothetical protein